MASYRSDPAVSYNHAKRSDSAWLYLRYMKSYTWQDRTGLTHIPRVITLSPTLMDLATNAAPMVCMRNTDTWHRWSISNRTPKNGKTSKRLTSTRCYAATISRDVLYNRVILYYRRIFKLRSHIQRAMYATACQIEHFINNINRSSSNDNNNKYNN